MWYWSTRTSGIAARPSPATRSSQYGMVIEMPFDLVAEVRCFFGRVCASSKANFRMRSTPVRVKTVSWITISRSVPSNIRPPTLEYSPSVFSRTTIEVDVARLAVRRAALRTPGISRTGRRLTYWSNSRRNWSSEPHSETWSGTVAGQPTAPKKIASWPRDLLDPVVGHHPAVLRVVVAAREVEVRRTRASMPKRARRGLEHAQALGHDFLADAVAGDDGDAIAA